MNKPSSNESRDTTMPPASLEQVLAFFDDIEPGKLPYPLFMKAAKLLTQATIEVVPLRKNAAGDTQVLLTQRADDDLWAGQWHAPGTILLASDQPKHPHDYSEALGRIIGQDGELKSGVRAVREPEVFATERRITLRGPELSVIHWVEVEGEPTVGQFFDTDNFPYNVPDDGVISHHADFIPRVVAHYEQLKNQ